MISITFQGADGVLTELKGTQSLINRAVKSAILKTSKKIEKDLEAAVSSELDIPKKALAKFRVKSRRMGGAGLVWMGYNPIKSGYIGNLRQEDWGASARSYMFKGGFVKTMRSGHIGIFKRDGDVRKLKRGSFREIAQPIVEQRVSILRSPAIASQIKDRAAQYYRDELARQIVSRLTK